MNWTRLRWVAVIAPAMFLAALDLIRHTWLPESLRVWPGVIALGVIVVVGAWLFSRALFDQVERAGRQLVEQHHALESAHLTSRRQAAQLRALHEAGLTLAADLTLEAVLQRVVDLSRELAGARYGALAVLDEQRNVVRFLTSGITAAERARLTDPPKGRGLLGALLTERGPVLVNAIAADPRSVGFPPGHPPMKTFVGVPIIARSRLLGNLYLTDKQATNPATASSGAATDNESTQPFTPEDADVLQLFAAQAAVAIENARLHAEVQALAASIERDRIARELHDSLAQALGYIRLTAATGRHRLAAGAGAEAETALTRIEDVAGDAYADVREAILGLRSRIGAERDLVAALEEYLERYRLQTGLPVDFSAEPNARAARVVLGAEAQLLRIIQEALANARKHARARRITVRLASVVDGSGAWLRATVADDGRGFDISAATAIGHYGLATMRERAEAVGGRVRFDSVVGGGSTVTVDIPAEAAPTPVEATVEGR